jgi:hypothetical protein
MADFKKVLQAAHDGYGHRKDFPPFAIAPWDDRTRWNEYLQTINDEMDKETTKNE